MSEHMRNDMLDAEYVLGTLRGPARRRFEVLMERDSALLAKVDRWQEAFRLLDAIDTPIQPPNRVWRTIQLRLPQRQETIKGFDKLSPNGDSFAQSAMPPRLRADWKARAFQYRWQFASFALAAALITIMVSPRLFVLDKTSSTFVPVAVLASTQVGHPQQMVVSFDDNNKKLIVTQLNLAAPATGHSLELWLIAQARKPESLGLLMPQDSQLSTQNKTRMATEVNPAVSSEPTGG